MELYFENSLDCDFQHLKKLGRRINSSDVSNYYIIHIMTETLLLNTMRFIF